MFRIYKLPLLSLLVTTVFVGCAKEPRDLNSLTILDDGIENAFLDGTVVDPANQKPYSGPVFFAGEDTDLPWNGSLKSGLVNGGLEIFHKNGQLKSSVSYANGEADGPYESYHENGQLDEKGTYVSGELDGPIEAYHENGESRLKATYVRGQLDGTYEKYYENGQVEDRRTYVNGEPDGLHEAYFRSGELRLRSRYANGQLNGPYESYMEGYLNASRLYSDTPDDGYVPWLDNKGTMEDGSPCGNWYDMDGLIRRTTSFDFNWVRTYAPCAASNDSTGGWLPRR